MNELEKIKQIRYLNELIAEMEKDLFFGKNSDKPLRGLIRAAIERRNSVFETIDKEAPYIHKDVQEGEFERRTSFYYVNYGFGTLLFYYHEWLWYENLGGSKKKMAISSVLDGTANPNL